MSNVDRLADLQDSTRKTPDPISAAEELATLLKLDEVGITIRRARVIGKGRTASVEIHLSNGETMHFDQGRLMMRPAELAAEVVACAHIYPKLNGARAGRAYELVYALGEHEEGETAVSIATDWGISYLQAADTLDVDLDDQVGRWAAFERIDDTTPASGDREQPANFASRTIVLRHSTGDRFVRIGWFYEYVQKCEGGGIARRDLSQRMRQVGWLVNGSTGRIKATSPSRFETRGWNFFRVPKGWEDDK